MPEDSPIKDAPKVDENYYTTWDPKDAKSKELAIVQMSKAAESYGLVKAHVGRERGFNQNFQDIDTNINAKNQFSRFDYEGFRPNDAIPTTPKGIIHACMEAYRKVGIIRNVIDLMGDFGCQGIEIVHPNRRIQNFYRSW